MHALTLFGAFVWNEVMMTQFNQSHRLIHHKKNWSLIYSMKNVRKWLKMWRMVLPVDRHTCIKSYLKSLRDWQRFFLSRVFFDWIWILKMIPPSCLVLQTRKEFLQKKSIWMWILDNVRMWFKRKNLFWVVLLVVSTKTKTYEQQQQCKRKKKFLNNRHTHIFVVFFQFSHIIRYHTDSKKHEKKKENKSIFFFSVSYEIQIEGEGLKTVFFVILLHVFFFQKSNARTTLKTFFVLSHVSGLYLLYLSLLLCIIYP